MRAKVLTLRFSPQLGRFDDAPLLVLQQKVVLEHLREHVMQIGGEPMLVCLAEWREQPPPTKARATAASGDDAQPSRSAIETSPNSAPPTPTRGDGPARPVGELRAELTDEQRLLFDRLRAWRSRTAHDEGAPPYVILTNRQLVELVRQRPDSKTGMARIDGLGDKKIAKHGEAILTLLWTTADERSALHEALEGATAANPRSEATVETPAEPFA